MYIFIISNVKLQDLYYFVYSFFLSFQTREVSLFTPVSGKIVVIDERLTISCEIFIILGNEGVGFP